MIKKYSFVFLLMIVFKGLSAQAPQKFSYQAVITDSSNKILKESQVGMKISVLQGKPAYNVVYSETQTPTTNENGLISIEIGTGSALSGSFSDINWAGGSCFIKTEIDFKGGNNYTITDTSELLSVPYALYSANGTPGSQGSPGVAGSNGQNTLVKTSIEAAGANCIAGGVKLEYGLDANRNDTLDLAEINSSLTKYICNGATGASGAAAPLGGFSHFIGELYNGGIIYYLYKGSDGLEHGLILALTETQLAWQTTSELVNANRTWDGVYNTSLMKNSPAATYIATLGAGWYLPSIDELNKLYNNRFEINKALFNGGYTLIANNYYWSSLETDASNAWNFAFNEGSSNADSGRNKTYANYVRAVRAF